jgi:hypothetical protein
MIIWTVSKLLKGERLAYRMKVIPETRCVHYINIREYRRGKEAMKT